MATYWLKDHLLTPLSGRRKLRNPVQMPSSVLSCTSRMPSPSSSRAHSRWPAVWQTVGWLRPVAGKWSYACHSSVFTVAPGWVCCSTKGCNVARSLWWRPFSPAFWYSSSASVTSSGSGPQGGNLLLDQRLDLVAARQHVSTINMQLCGQVFGGHPLGNATQDLDDGRAAIMALDPDGPSEEIEDRATGTTAVVQDRGTMPVMGCLLGGQAMPGRAAQPLGMQDMQQDVVAGLLIHQIVERKLQHQEPSLR